MSSLHVAVYHGSLELTKALLEELKAEDHDLLSKCINLRLPTYGSPLFTACVEGHTELIDLLVGYGADLKQPPGPTSTRTILRQAIGIGNPAVIASLVRNGVDVNALDDSGGTPLNWALGQENVAAALQLLSLGADPNKPGDRGVTPLMTAAVGSRPSALVAPLVEAGADPEQRMDSGDTALTAAIIEGEDGGAEAVRELLRAGAAVDAPGRNGGLPLGWALARGLEDVARALLDAGATISGDRDTILHALVENGTPPAMLRLAVRLLEERSPGGAVSSRNARAETPLHLAAQAGDRAAALVLLDAGAEVNAETGGGLTPLCAARAGGHDEVADLLIERGADAEYAKRLRALEIEGVKYQIIVEEDCTEEEWEKIKAAAREQFLKKLGEGDQASLAGSGTSKTCF
ncbi:hypothetical protein GGTG_10912 [Gaeumannomyces tritici R3-111a-1]|uniref:Uncharacterized protein n=1 Tax=Gaeumannomyces tritici (strain R3-111a-1) TaxID=644352 RepID=J3PBP1_GAET3|nr:hypothetical protein GGTG_10912 [Gaeumannomyces tritici R3-111a-1]EJT71658.1 hypothetical protein GGTG_10912 [Gaeumannomyces tritici R3-111a-1]